MKIVGIIGGLGPATTADFYLDIINTAQIRSKENRAHALISSVPIPFNVESDLIIKNSGVARYLPYLLNEARRLENAGAEFIVMPCNSMHIFINELKSSVNIPVLSIIDETVKYIQKQGVQNLGIISTAMTVKKKLYQNAFTETKIHFNIPSRHDQSILDKIILNIVMGENTQKDYDLLINVIKNFKNSNTENIVLACTDLQLLKPFYQGIQIHDSMKIFADATVDYMLK